ncbi:hypothetical protein BGZ46_006218, partial [Entomortierella lignicola]
MDKTDITINAERIRNNLKVAENQIRLPRRDKMIKETAQTAARRTFNEDQNIVTYGKLKQARYAVRGARKVVGPQEASLKLLRSESYQWNKLERAAPLTRANTNRPAANMTIPTWDSSKCEDDTLHTDITKLMSDCSEDRAIVFSGTDYGLCKMSQTVALRREQIIQHLNYYQILA